jgi:hypothetical protein
VEPGIRLRRPSDRQSAGHSVDGSAGIIPTCVLAFPLTTSHTESRIVGHLRGFLRGFWGILRVRNMRDGGRQRHPGERGREDADGLVSPLSRRQGMAGPSALEGQCGLLQQTVKRARVCPLYLRKEGIYRAGVLVLATVCGLFGGPRSPGRLPQRGLQGLDTFLTFPDTVLTPN